MPTFYDTHNTRISFSTNEVELWLRRLRILYQIDKGRNYGDVIDYILSILQFIPAPLLLPLVHITMDTYSIDEIMLNDIARARMYMLEEWAADGHSDRPVKLTEFYRTLSPSALITVQQTTAASTKMTDDEQNSGQVTISTMPDFEEPAAPFDSNFAD
jgi:hypothetical protein